jgi:calmodulin
MDYKEAFTLFDQNGDGKIDAAELKSVMTSINMSPTDEQIAKMIKEADADQDGAVNEAEFIALMSRQVAGADSEADIVEAFKTLADDQNDTGLVAVDELKNTMKNVGLKLSDTEIEELLKDAAADTADGKVNYKAFAARFYKPIE